MAESKDLFERGWALLRDHKVDEARALFLQHQQATGTRAQSDKALAEGAAAHEAGRLQEAAVALEQVLELNPTIAKAHQHLAEIALEAGELEAAQTHAEASVMLAPNESLSWMLMGMVQSALGRRDEATKALTRARDLDPKDPEAWSLLVDLPFNEGRYAEAKAVVDAGLKACGESPLLHEKGLACAMMLKDPAAGISYVERQLKLVPDHEQGHLNLARLKMLAGDLPGSVAAARALLARNPKSSEAHFHLGNVFEAEKKTVEALTEYRAALKLSPKDWRYASNLGALLVSDGGKPEYEEARKLLTAILPHVPEGEWRPTYNLALAYVRLGDKAQAKELAGKILRSAKSADPMSEEARKLLANLEG